VAGVFTLGIVGISFAALFVRWALPAPPLATAFWRMVLASALLAAWFVARRQPLWPEGRAAWLAPLAGAFFGTDLALWHTAAVKTSLSNATFLVNTTPVVVGAVALLQGERLGPRFPAGAALALAGTALLLGADWSGDAALEGDALALAAALFYGGYLVLMKAVRHTTGTRSALLAVGVGSSAVLALYAGIRGDPLLGFPASSWWAFAGAALVAQLAGVMSVIWSLRYLRATFTSVALLGQPVGTTVLAWLLMGEALGPLEAMGALAVGAGIALASAAARDEIAPQENSRGSHQG
jgi:drug/metabolite transporter (DMT)-like permease